MSENKSFSLEENQEWAAEYSKKMTSLVINDPVFAFWIWDGHWTTQFTTTDPAMIYDHALRFMERDPYGGCRIAFKPSPDRSYPLGFELKNVAASGLAPKLGFTKDEYIGSWRDSFNDMQMKISAEISAAGATLQEIHNVGVLIALHRR